MNYASGTGNQWDQTTEIYVKKILAGNVADVRARIASVAESFGYDIIEDEPHIVARRGARGWGTWYASADVMDYPMTLTVRLKSLSENSTRATFDYVVKHPMLNNSEKSIVVQEAAAIASLSKVQAIEKECSVCETESADDSKFCRKCGAPLTSEQAEMEVLRMMAEIRAGKTSTVTSSILILISFLILVTAFALNSVELLKPKVFLVLFSLGGITLLFAMITSFFAWHRSKRALEKTAATVLPPAFYRAPETLVTGELRELPPRSAHASVTEGTTNLLDEEWSNRREKEKVPNTNRRDTNNFD